MLYFDSAYIAKCYLPEAGHAEVTALAASGPRIVSVALARIEIVAVFHRKLREKSISPAVHRELGHQFNSDADEGVWRFLPMTDALIAKSQSIYRSLPPEIFLRAVDCLHLCSAKEAGFKEIYSNDRHLLAAAAHFGLRGVNVIT